MRGEQIKEGMKIKADHVCAISSRTGKHFYFENCIVEKRSIEINRCEWLVVDDYIISSIYDKMQIIFNGEIIFDNTPGGKDE